MRGYLGAITLIFISVSAWAQVPDMQNIPNNMPNMPAPQAVPQPLPSADVKTIEKKLTKRVKDPFMLPDELYLKIKKKLGDVQGEGYVDESVDPPRRWALKHYKLLAVIWNVKKPKAMFRDRKGDNHIFYVNDKIANNEGVITSIHGGEVVVREKDTEIKLRLPK